MPLAAGEAAPLPVIAGRRVVLTAGGVHLAAPPSGAVGAVVRAVPVGS